MPGSDQGRLGKDSMKRSTESLAIMALLRREARAVFKLGPWVLGSLLLAALLWRPGLAATGGLFQSAPATPTVAPATSTLTPTATTEALPSPTATTEAPVATATAEAPAQDIQVFAVDIDADDSSRRLGVDVLEPVPRRAPEHNHRLRPCGWSAAEAGFCLRGLRPFVSCPACRSYVCVCYGRGLRAQCPRCLDLAMGIIRFSSEGRFRRHQ